MQKTEKKNNKNLIKFQDKLYVLKISNSFISNIYYKKFEVIISQLYF